MFIFYLKPNTSLFKEFRLPFYRNASGANEKTPQPTSRYKTPTKRSERAISGQRKLAAKRATTA